MRAGRGQALPFGSLVPRKMNSKVLKLEVTDFENWNSKTLKIGTPKLCEMEGQRHHRGQKMGRKQGEWGRYMIGCGIESAASRCPCFLFFRLRLLYMRICSLCKNRFDCNCAWSHSEQSRGEQAEQNLAKKH